MNIDYPHLFWGQWGRASVQWKQSFTAPNPSSRCLVRFWDTCSCSRLEESLCATDWTQPNHFDFQKPLKPRVKAQNNKHYFLLKNENNTLSICSVCVVLQQQTHLRSLNSEGLVPLHKTCPLRLYRIQDAGWMNGHIRGMSFSRQRKTETQENSSLLLSVC